AQRRPRFDGAYRLLPRHPRVRGRRRRRLPDHRRLGGDRDVPHPGRGGSGRPRRPGRGRPCRRPHPGTRPGDRRRSPPTRPRRAHLRPPRRPGRRDLAGDPPAGTERRLMRLVVLGLSLSSSWGNGHATTFRALLKAFAARGHDILFLERDVPWYRDNRDETDPTYCRLAYYSDLEDMKRWAGEIAAADAVIVG